MIGPSTVRVETALKRLCIEIRDTVCDRAPGLVYAFHCRSAGFVSSARIKRIFFSFSFPNSFAADDCGTFAYEKMNFSSTRVVVYDVIQIMGSRF